MWLLLNMNFGLNSLSGLFSEVGENGLILDSTTAVQNTIAADNGFAAGSRHGLEAVWEGRLLEGGGIVRSLKRELWFLKLTWKILKTLLL